MQIRRSCVSILKHKKTHFLVDASHYSELEAVVCAAQVALLLLALMRRSRTF